MLAYRHNDLYMDDIKLSLVAEKIKTPVYCYSYQRIKENYTEFARNMPNVLVCFAMKSNSNMAILQTLAEMGSGVDVVSVGELKMALKAGFPPSKIVYSGVGKGIRELAYALRVGVLQINVESLQELWTIDKLAISLGHKAQVAIRLNPNIDALTSQAITTGTMRSKFGIPIDQVEDYANYQYENVDVVGISVHVGSQIQCLEVINQMTAYVKQAVKRLEVLGFDIKRIDVGGGLGISYSHRNDVPTIADYARVIQDNLDTEKYQVICEPGRAIVGDAGVLLSKVLVTKANDMVAHVVLDAGMNDFMRPALYDAKHKIIPVEKKPLRDYRTVDVVGPVCETSDTFYRNYYMQEAFIGDYLAICDVGAYGSSMMNTYNCRRTPAEVLVNGNEFALVRRRMKYKRMQKSSFKSEGMMDW